MFLGHVLAGDISARFADDCLQGCCSLGVIVKSTGIITSDKEQRKAPLLLLELIITPDGTGFAYSTAPDAVHEHIISLFDRAINKLQGLPQLEPAVMEKLFWPTVPILSSVHLQEQVTITHRDGLSKCVAAALQPVKEYLAQYKTYEGLLTLSVEGYIDALQVTVWPAVLLLSTATPRIGS